MEASVPHSIDGQPEPEANDTSEEEHSSFFLKNEKSKNHT